MKKDNKAHIIIIIIIIIIIKYIYIAQVRRRVGKDITIRLVLAVIMSRLDYCNSVLAGLPQSTLQPLQRVQNAAAQLICDVPYHEHITSYLRELHCG